MTYDINFIHDLLEPSILDASNSFYESLIDDFCDSIDLNLAGFYRENGATKLVLIPLDDDKDFVIKIPFTGTINYDYEEHDCDEERSSSSKTSSYYDYVGESYIDFHNSGRNEGDWDYCATEANRYNIAKEEGFEIYFAETRLIGHIRDYPIYVQEKCTVFSGFTNSHDPDINKKTIKVCKDAGFDYWMPIDWLTDFRFYYGEARLTEFIHFLYEKDWYDDLRGPNLGYIGDRPVLIDYSGYSEQE